jgi:predicted metal-dependent phosphoesterase TrpH
MHSVESDGHHTPEQMLALAGAGGLDVMALSDHDLAPALTAGVHQVGGRTVRVIAAVELSTMHMQTEQHLLVYFPGQMPAEFSNWCTQRAIWRADWYDACLDALGLTAVPRADERARAGLRCLTRVHLARALVDAGVALSRDHAFKEWIGTHSGRIPPLALGLYEALGVAKEAGGWTSWAHPSPTLAEQWAPGLAEAGLCALEAWRPSGGKHRRDTLHRLAIRQGMAITGGSDWHGRGPRKLGSFSVPWRVLGATATHLQIDSDSLAEAPDSP